MTFVVLALHAGFLEEFSNFGNFVTTQGPFRIAVPVFLLVNGFFLTLLTTEVVVNYLIDARDGAFDNYLSRSSYAPHCSSPFRGFGSKGIPSIWRSFRRRSISCTPAF